jgi:hypothetical protein
MTVAVTGNRDVIDDYSVRIAHGHALAHQLFSHRLTMISDIQKVLAAQGQLN